MLCRIADLYVEIPEAGGMAPRCQAYMVKAAVPADIRLDAAAYQLDRWPGLSYDNGCYMASGSQFYIELLHFGGMLLHASALEYQGKAYLFSGPSGVGKSTHTRLWQQVFGSGVRIFNDDKPALRQVDGQWYAYGTPWCGKDGINENRSAPLAGICFLKQTRENRIRQLPAPEAIGNILSQTISMFCAESRLDKLLRNVDSLVRSVPVWELENVPGEAAVRLAYETMRGSDRKE